MSVLKDLIARLKKWGKKESECELIGLPYTPLSRIYVQISRLDDINRYIVLNRSGTRSLFDASNMTDYDLIVELYDACCEHAAIHQKPYETFFCPRHRAPLGFSNIFSLKHGAVVRFTKKLEKLVTLND